MSEAKAFDAAETSLSVSEAKAFNAAEPSLSVYDDVSTPRPVSVRGSGRSMHRDATRSRKVAACGGCVVPVRKAATRAAYSPCVAVLPNASLHSLRFPRSASLAHLPSLPPHSLRLSLSLSTR